MTNIDTYLSNAKKTQNLALDLVKNIGHDINCHIDVWALLSPVITTTTTTTSTPPVRPQPSPTTPSNVGPTFDECVQAMGGLHEYFTSEYSLNEQTAVFISAICSNMDETCEDHFGKFYASAAPCLHDSFFSEPRDLCERVFSSGVEINKREMSCEWCTYYMQAFAYLWTQPESLANGLSILHGECFCGKDGMEADYENCHEEVDKYYPICLTVAGEALQEYVVVEDICQDAFDVC